MKVIAYPYKCNFCKIFKRGICENSCDICKQPAWIYKKLKISGTDGKYVMRWKHSLICNDIQCMLNIINTLKKISTTIWKYHFVIYESNKGCTCI